MRTKSTPLRSARLEAHLRARINRRYQTATEPIRIGGLQIAFTRIKRPDDVLDQIVEEEDRRERLTGIRRNGEEIHLPYWAELWDSALGVGQFLVHHLHRTSPRLQPWASVLDLGCGMGLAGTVAAALGHRVTLVDLEAPALLFSRLNTLPFHERAHVRKLDWRRDHLSERFDLILGSDVLYDRKQWEFLESFWRAHLHQDGKVLLGEPGRQTGELFPDWIARRGWRVEELDQSIPTRDSPIRIFLIAL